jgi:hypothetical protein
LLKMRSSIPFVSRFDRLSHESDRLLGDDPLRSVPRRTLLPDIGAAETVRCHQAQAHRRRAHASSPPWGPITPLTRPKPVLELFEE